MHSSCEDTQDTPISSPQPLSLINNTLAIFQLPGSNICTHVLHRWLLFDASELLSSLMMSLKLDLGRIDGLRLLASTQRTSQANGMSV